jgi:transposase
MTEPDRGGSADGAQPGRPEAGTGDREVIAAYQHGLTLSECADKFRLSSATVANIMKRHGVSRRARGPRGPSAATRQAVIAAYRDEGLSIKECIRRAGVSRETVHTILDGAGIHRDPRRRALRTAVDRRALAKAYREGMSLRQCAARFGIAPATVVSVLDQQREPRRRAARSVVDEDALLARYRTGVSVSRCAREFGISRDVAAGVLDRRGVPRHRQRSGVDERALVAAYQQSLSVSECARKFGISPRTVGRMLDRHNITRQY